MTATTPTTRTEWQFEGKELVSCNCDWGCPCQFNALPTHDFCEAVGAIQIDRGQFGETPLDGVTFAMALHWDGPIHEGNGWRQLIIDARATPEQRAAIEALVSGTQGHPFFEIFAAVAPNTREPMVAPIQLEHDKERRQALLHIPGIAESDIEPIRNPVTGEEHRARIDLPNGFEYTLAEVANSRHWRATAGDHLTMEHDNTYAQLAHITWSSDGTTR